MLSQDSCGNDIYRVNKRNYNTRMNGPRQAYGRNVVAMILMPVFCEVGPVLRKSMFNLNRHWRSGEKKINVSTRILDSWRDRHLRIIYPLVCLFSSLDNDCESVIVPLNGAQWHFVKTSSHVGDFYLEFLHFQEHFSLADTLAKALNKTVTILFTTWFVYSHLTNKITHGQTSGQLHSLYEKGNLCIQVYPEISLQVIFYFPGRFLSSLNYEQCPALQTKIARFPLGP